MTWNYRLVWVAEDWVEIKEVYYDSAGRPEAYSDTSVSGETTEDVRAALNLMQAAWDQPSLRLSECGRLVFPEHEA